MVRGPAATDGGDLGVGVHPVEQSQYLLQYGDIAKIIEKEYGDIAKMIERSTATSRR